MNVGGSRVREYQRAWAEMDPDILGMIFNRLRLEVKLKVIPRVCKPWRHAVEADRLIGLTMIHKDKRQIGWDGFLISIKPQKQLGRMLVRMLVTRSSGYFRELHVSYLKDLQLSFIAHHARSLRVLSVRASLITDSMVEQVAPKLTSLTAIDLSYCKAITARSIEAIGTNCKSLESLTWNVRTWWCDTCMLQYKPFPPDQDEWVRAIARTMPKLKHLNIAFANVSNEVGHHILSACPELESFNVDGCYHLRFLPCEVADKYPKVNILIDGSLPDDQWIGCCRGYVKRYL